MMRPAAPYWLASASPRRRLMLSDAGIPIEVKPADIDDGTLAPGRVPPEAWVMALAYLKARRVAEMLCANGREPAQRGTVIGADTVCIHDSTILGQPRDAAHASEMILAMRNRTHITVTGVALLALSPTAARKRSDAHERSSRETVNRAHAQPHTARLLFFDRARVTVGDIPDDEVNRYIASGEWQGKAGAYNLSERIDAGWSIRVEGDPATVMGLPMQRLLRMLNRSAEHAT